MDCDEEKSDRIVNGSTLQPDIPECLLVTCEYIGDGAGEVRPSAPQGVRLRAVRETCTSFVRVSHFPASAVPSSGKDIDLRKVLRYLGAPMSIHVDAELSLSGTVFDVRASEYGSRLVRKAKEAHWSYGGANAFMLFQWASTKIGQVYLLP